MNAIFTPTVGARVIFRKTFGSQPVRTQVVRVTKSGMFECEAAPGLLFKAARYGAQQSFETQGVMKDGTCWPFSEERWAEAQKIYAEAEARRAEKERERQESRDARELASRLQMASTQLALGGSLLGVVRAREVHPDGSRSYWLAIPVKSELAERKAGFEMLWVRCKDSERFDFQASRNEDGDHVRKVVQAAYTYANGNSSSFASVSTSTYASDEEALWASIDSQYHSW